MLHRLAVIITLVLGLTFVATTSAAAQASSQCNVPITGATGLVQTGEQQVVQMICKVHTQIYVMVAKLKKIGDTKAAGNETRSYTVSYAVKLIAWIALLVFSYAMIVVAMQVFEVIVRLAIYTALAPFIIYCAVYPNTRHIFDNAIKGYIYATIKFTLLGAFLAAGLMIAKLCTDAVGSLANTIDSMSTAVSSESVAQAISYAGVAFVTGMMIGRIMTAASTAAAELSAYAYANLGVAAGGMTALATATRTVMGAAMFGALAAPAVLRGGFAAFKGTASALKKLPLAGDKITKTPGAAYIGSAGILYGATKIAGQILKPGPTEPDPNNNSSPSPKGPQ